MQVNNLEGREVMIIGFGGVILLTLVVLSSIYVGHAITAVSNVPQPVQVMPAQAAVNVHVPAQSAPKVEVTATAPGPHIDVHVPSQATPVVNFTPPPAQITVVEREKPAPVVPAAPAPKTDPKPVPAAVEPRSEAKSVVTVDALYACAEHYIETQCRKVGLDPVAENAKWLKRWQSRIVDSGLDEQELLNRTVVDSRDCFDVQKATPEKICEACRLMLRYRDTKLQWLQALKDAMTEENLQKTIAFLSTGGK